MRKELEKVREGNTVVIDGIAYIFDEVTADAYNIWADLLEHGLSETQTTIDLLTENGVGGESFPPTKIKEALEKKEWNKTPHGL